MPAPRQVFYGHVIKTAMQKTVKVRVEKIKMHPLVKKPVRFHKNFLVHDENQELVVGDYVKIEQCNKISKMKHFKLGEIVVPAQRFIDEEGVLHSQGISTKLQAPEYNLKQYGNDLPAPEAAK